MPKPVAICPNSACGRTSLPRDSVGCWTKIKGDFMDRQSCVVLPAIMHHADVLRLVMSEHESLTLSQTRPAFYVSAVQVF